MKELIAFGVSIALCSTVVAGEFHVSPAGSDANGGTKAAPLKTISAAAAKAQPGDLITVHEGVYRERINPPRGGTSDEKRIVYQAAPGENVVIKGSERVTGWTHVEKDAWKVTLPDSFFGDFNPYGDLLHGDWYEAKQPYHTGAVYLNGHWLKEAARKNLVVESAPSGAVEEGRPELMNIRQLITGGKNGKNLMAAEFKSASDGVEIIKLPDGLTCVGRMRDGATLTYEMEVGEEARHLATYAASPLEGGIIEIRKGSAEGELLGKFDVGFTAEWTSFQPYHANLSQPLSGKQILTLVFKARPRQLVAPSDDSAFWFAEFGKESTTIWAQFKGVDPNKELVEINVRQSVFYPDQTGRNFITVKGFTLEQAATPWAPPTAEQIGLIGAHWSKGWVIEENTIRYSTCAGVSLGKDRDEMDNKHDMRATIRLATKAGWSGENVGHHLVRNNQIDNCGQAALVGSLGGIFSTIEGNEIHDIRKNHDYDGCETAGIKMHGAVDVVIRDNHIYNCAHWGGLWLDWMAQGARVTGNLLHDNSQDMMLEVNHGPFLVDNNLLLSRQQITKVSSSGAYVHNLWSDNFGIWPTEGRQTPYFKPHSTEIIKESAINQNDDRYFNNIFVGPKGTSAMDEHGFSLIGSGNVFLGGAIPSKNEQKAIEAKDFDPKMEFTKESDGWWLKMTVDPAWSKEVQRNVVTTELLGKAAVTGAAYEQRDGKPHQLDTDYFGNKWPENSPSPGPFALSGEKELRVKVWPKKANTEGSLAARKNAPTTEKEEDVKSLTYKKVGDAELEMKIHYPAHWEAGGKKLPAIVLFFGGGWYAGDIGQFRFTAPYLAQRGMIVVTPEYRTIKKHGVTPVQCLADAKSAMRYVHKNATALGIDAGRIAAGGISAGGHLAAATAFSKGFDDPDDDLQINCKPSALVLIVPVIDNGPGGFAHSQVSAYWEAFSPMHNIGLNPPPTLFMVGDSDKYIPVATAQKFKAEIEKHGGRCDLKIFENADHAFNFSPTGSKATLQDMDDFLVSLGYLKTKEIPLDKKNKQPEASTMKTRHANWLSSGPFRLSDEKDIWVKVWPKSIKKKDELCKSGTARRIGSLLSVMLLMSSAGFADESVRLRPPAVPLVTHDPYFSIWSAADRLTDAPTTHWTGRPLPMNSTVSIDGQVFRLMGMEPGGAPALPQIELCVLPTRTIYRFGNEKTEVVLTFLTPALPSDLDALSWPLTYLSWEVRSVDGSPHAVRIDFDISGQLAMNEQRQEVVWDRPQVEGLLVSRVGMKDQRVLGRKGDFIMIDWGYAYLAVPSDARTRQTKDGAVSFDLGQVGVGKAACHAMLAYDDLYSIRYFGSPLRAYWRRKGWEAPDLLKAAAQRYDALAKRCTAFDDALMADLSKVGGAKYAALCALAYRQTLAGNKLAADAKGMPLLFPKENNSNGCISTVDVLFPQAPFFLVFSPALTKAMLVPVLDYAASPQWPYRYAPHDLGTYPWAEGQVYSMQGGNGMRMPLEESGNMLIMMAALTKIEGQADFAKRYWPLMTMWADYCVEEGLDPQNQLCSADMFGNLQHSTNLALKAIIGIGGYAQMCDALGKTEEAKKYMDIARDYAARWQVLAKGEGHTLLAYDKPGTWAMKHNLIWDRVLGTDLFPEAVGDAEIAWYLKVQNEFGLPVDNRTDTSLIDWALWSIALARNPADFQALFDPIFRYANETPSRIPLSDWFKTKTGERRDFMARPVVGGIFIKLLADPFSWRRWAGLGQKVSGEWAHQPEPLFAPSKEVLPQQASLLWGRR